MYLKKIEIENYGPYENMNIDLRFDSNNNPIPLILIGKNGSGKTILLSHIVNSFISAKQVSYEDSEVEQGKVYKYRSTAYIHSGKSYSFSKIVFTDNSYVSEWQLIGKRKDLEQDPSFSQPRPEWQNIPMDENSFFESTFTEQTSNDLISKNCILYFPSNRFEDPGWLNKENLVNQVEYQDLKRIKGFSNRNIVCTNSLKTCQKWLLDILLDRNTLEIQTGPLPLPEQIQHVVNLQVFYGFSGQASQIYDEIIKLLNKVFDEPGTLRFGLGTRKRRELSIMKSEKKWISNLFQLSSGESLLLGLFLTIIKDYDLANTNFSNFNDITGIVVIDEIDSHLHTKLQKEILPSLIQLFPKVQFIITTHSPMFLLGMESLFGSTNYDIVELPSATNVCIEQFTEFVDLFSAITQNKLHLDLVNSKIKESQLPIVFVEGDYDIKYLTKAIEMFNKNDLLTRFRFADGEGFGNLDKIWTSMHSRVAHVLTAKTLLLYDCDIKKTDSDNGLVYKRTIPSIYDNPISIGIENLLSSNTVQKLEAHNPAFIDINPSRTERVRGSMITYPEKKMVNKDEKKNICQWLVQNGDTSDFEGFLQAINIIEQFLE